MSFLRLARPLRSLAQQAMPKAMFAKKAAASLRAPVLLVAKRRMGGGGHGHGEPSSYLDKKEVLDRVLLVVSGFEKVDKSKLSKAAHFRTDLGLDSLDEVEVVMAFEDEFGIEISDANADKIHSIEDAVNYIAAAPFAK